MGDRSGMLRRCRTSGMARNWAPYALAALFCALLAGPATPASAGASDKAYAQARPHVTIHPRHRVLRYCRSWLAEEYRVSGPVIVPRMYCWWG